MADIHPTALVSARARLGHDVTVGPFAIVEDDAVLGEGCRLDARVTIKRGVQLGARNLVLEGTVLGGKPQHRAAREPLGDLIIGDDNEFRENVTIHRGLAKGDVTVIGSGNLFMVGAHVGHDCRLGDHILMVNNTLLGGHAIVEDRVYLAGAAAVHQFCRIGRYAMVGGQSHIVQDVPPYVLIDGVSNKVVGLNVIGLRRAGFGDDDIRQLKRAYRVIYRSGLTWNEVLSQLRASFSTGPAADFEPFLSVGKRGFVQERRTPKAATVRLPAEETREAAPPVRKVG